MHQRKAMKLSASLPLTILIKFLIPDFYIFRSTFFEYGIVIKSAGFSELYPLLNAFGKVLLVMSVTSDSNVLSAELLKTPYHINIGQG